MAQKNKPQAETLSGSPQPGFIGYQVASIIAKRAPTTLDTGYPLGQLWVDKINAASYQLQKVAAGVATWALLGTDTGALNTLTGDSGGAISPSAGNINVLGTASQITTTGAGATLTWSLPATMIVPGSLEVTTNLLVDGTSTVTGLTTLGALTQVGTANINASGAAATAIATGGTGTLALGNATGNTTLTGSFSTLTAAGTFAIGTSAQTGTTTIVSSTAANSVLIQNGVNTAAQVVSIANGATASTSTVNILSGVGTAGVASLLMADNPQATVIDLGNVAPNAARVTTIAGGNSAQNDTVTILGGAPSAGTQTFNLFSGVASGGTQTVNIATGASAHGINIGTGAAVINTIAIGGTGANVITIGNTQTTGSIAVGNALTSGTIALGGTAGTGSITIGQATNATGQTVSIASGTSNAGANIVSILNGTTPGASTTLNVMNGAASAGTQTINMLATGATRAGAVNIGTGAAAHVLTIGSTTASASLTLQAGSGTTGISLSAAGNVQMAPAIGSSSSTPITLAGRNVQATFTGFTTAAAASQVFTITNSALTATTQQVHVSVDNLGSNDAQLTITRVLLAVGSIAVTVKNNGAAALNGDVHVNAWITN